METLSVLFVLLGYMPQDSIFVWTLGDIVAATTAIFFILFIGIVYLSIVINKWLARRRKYKTNK